jgi:hypothetical protein
MAAHTGGELAGSVWTADAHGRFTPVQLTWAASGKIQSDSALDRSRPDQVSKGQSRQSPFPLWPVDAIKMISLWKIAWFMNCRDSVNNL